MDEDIDGLIQERQRIAVDLMAGSGADVFLIQDGTWDVEKMVKSGALADVTEFYDSHDEIFEEIV